MILIMLEDLKSQLEALPGHAESFETGHHLFQLGDKVTVIHFIEQGSVQLIRHQADGSVLVLQRARSGSILAEASLYSDVYHCDAVAVTPSRAISWPKQAIRDRLMTNPAFSDAWARRLAHEVQRTRLQAEILSLKTVAARLDAWIAWNDGQAPEKGAGKAVAEQIGVSPEAFYRELARRRPGRA